MATKFQVDMKAALQQSAACLQLHKAAKKQVTAWAAESQTALMRSAKRLQKTGGKGGHLANNIAFTVSEGEASWTVVIGTGVGGKSSVKYARIQDKGGIVKPVKGQYLTIPFSWARGRTAKSIPKKQGVFIKTKKGSLLLAEKRGKDNLMPMFTLVKQVKIPPTYWFTQVMSHDRKAALGIAMEPDAVMARARTMVK
jgi:hypothetical protein